MAITPPSRASGAASRVGAAPFWVYTQGMIHGHYVVDQQRGLSTTVFVQAMTPPEADQRLVAAGGYFRGVEAGVDCSCCGDRWSPAGSERPMSVMLPEIYGFAIDGSYNHPDALLPQSVAALISHRRLLSNASEPLAYAHPLHGDPIAFRYPKMRIKRVAA